MHDPAKQSGVAVVRAAGRVQLTRLRSRWRIYLYVLPSTLVILAIAVFPFVYSLRISFYDYLMQTDQMRFVGLDNFVGVLRDQAFYGSLLATARIGVPSLIIEFLLGLLLAILLNSIRRGRSLFTSLLAVPVLIAPAAAGMSFRMLFTPQWGPANHILGFVAGRPVQIDWLGTTSMAPISIVIADVWQMTPFVMLIVLAGLTSVPEELYEAARIDGASSWRMFVDITLPLIKFYLGVVVILRAIDLFKLFDLPFVMTHGGPADATQTISFYAYQVGIQFLRIGYAAALSLIMLWLVVFMSRLLLRFVREGTA